MPGRRVNFGRQQTFAKALASLVGAMLFFTASTAVAKKPLKLADSQCAPTPLGTRLARTTDDVRVASRVRAPSDATRRACVW